MARSGALVLLFNILPFFGGAAAADLADASCKTNSAACENDVASLVQTNVAALQRGTHSVESFHSMARSIKSAEGQLAMVEYGENLVRQLRVETANGTKHLSNSEQVLLGEVISLIRDTMYGSMRAAHTSDQQLLIDKAASVDACNTDLQTALAGTVQTAKNASDDGRSDHITCRDTEQVHYVWKTGNQSALNTLLGDIPTPPEVPATLTRTVPGVEAYFAAAKPYVDWYTQWSASFTTTENSSTTASNSHQEQRTLCNHEQASFEAAYLSWKQNLETTCSAYCHANETAAYTALKSALEPLEENRKKAYSAGEILVYQIKCLLATGDCSNKTAPDAAEFVLDEPDTQQVLVCDTTDVVHEPCDAAFLAANYNEHLPMNAQENDVNDC